MQEGNCLEYFHFEVKWASICKESGVEVLVNLGNHRRNDDWQLIISLVCEHQLIPNFPNKNGIFYRVFNPIILDTSNPQNPSDSKIYVAEQKFEPTSSIVAISNCNKMKSRTITLRMFSIKVRHISNIAHWSIQS